MKDIALHINYKTKPEKLAGSLRSQDLKQGDKLIVNSILSEEMTLMIVILILHYFKQQKIDYADEMLKDIFATKGSKEIQDDIAKEYGIEIEIESTSEEDNWYPMPWFVSHEPRRRKHPKSTGFNFLMYSLYGSNGVI